MRIKELRNELNLSQLELAQAVNTSQRNISRWENGENEPTSSFLMVLANFFECSIDYLVGRSDDFGNVNVQSPLNAALTKEEQKLLDVYRKLDMKDKIHVETYAELRLEEMKGRSSHRA